MLCLILDLSNWPQEEVGRGLVTRAEISLDDESNAKDLQEGRRLSIYSHCEKLTKKVRK
jgi:hypothetical protein